MSDFDGFNEHHKRHKERREERHEARHDYGDHDNYGQQYGQGYRREEDEERHPIGDQGRRSQQYGQGYRREEDEGRRPFEDQGRRSQQYGQGYRREEDEERHPIGDQGRGYGPPSGIPPQSRFDRGDFASDADVDRMIASGDFEQRQGRGYGGRGYGDGADDARGHAHGGYNAPSGPPPGGRYDAPSGPYSGGGRYDTPSGPPPGRGYQNDESRRQGVESGGGYGSSYGGGSDRPSQYGSSQTHGRDQYDAPQGFPSSHGRGQGNTPSGGFTASRDGEERYGGASDRTEPFRRGEAASYYNSQGGSGDRYAHLSTLAQEHGDDDPEVYRQATQGLHERIQRQSRDDDYSMHVDAHQKAYGGDHHGQMDSDSIGAAAAMEAFKQTVGMGGSSNAPAGAFKASNVAGGLSSKFGRADEEEAGATAARAGDSRGMQDKLMALAMSHAGKLFDKKNGGSSGGAAKPEDKAQAMQSAAASAMQLFTKYQSSGKLDASDMSSVMALASKLF